MTDEAAREERSFLAGGGEAGALMRRPDWWSRPAGHPAGWPDAVKAAVGLALEAPVPVMVWLGRSVDELVQLHNDAFGAIVGPDRNAADLGRRGRDTWPESWGTMAPLLAEALQGRAVRHEDVTVAVSRGGASVEASCTLAHSPVRSQDGAVVGVLTLLADTTAQRRAERERSEALALVRVQSEQLAASFDAAPVGLAMLDTDLRFLRVNRRLADWNGRPPADHIGKTVGEIVPELDAAALGVLRAVLKGEPIWGAEISATTPASPDRVKTWRENWVPVRDEAGRIIGAAVSVEDVTREAQAEKALRESEARLQLALDVADLGTWELDLDGGRISRSLRHDQMFGYGELQPEWTAVIARHHVIDEDRPHFDEALARARETSKLRCEMRVRRPDGSVRWIASFGRVMPDSDGRPARIAGVVQDITARKEAEAALRDSEEQLRLATEAAEISLWDVDEVRRTLYWPPRLKAMFGISPDRPVSMTDFYSGLHPDDRERVTAAYAAAADPERRALYDVEYRTVGKEDGVVRWVAAKGRAIFDARGRCLRVIGTAIDISARKEAAARLEASEAELRVLATTLERRVAERTAELSESERRFRAIFDTTFQLTSLGTLDGTLLVVNRAALDAAEVTLEAVTGQKMWDSPWWRESPREIERLKQGLARVGQGAFIRYEARLSLPAGERTFDFSMKPVLDEAGRPILVVAEGRDITDQRLAEEALRQAQKMEAIGQLTGGIAHDFNNLLQGVVGSFDLIRRAPQDEARVRRWADAGLHAAERGAKLTGQLLAFSRSQKLEVRPLPLTPVIEGVRDMLGRTLGPSVQIEMRLEAGDAWVLGDRVQLEMAILNLAINARDAMPDGGRLAIATRARHIASAADVAEGDYVELSFSDTGKGMTPEVMARAFDPFFTTKSVGKGTGLGLSQVYGAIRQAGGAARIRSEPGQGTLVELLLRRTEPAAVPDGPEERESAIRRGQGRVLVIDDDPDVRQFLADALQSFGFEVSVAEDGASGLGMISASDIKAVLVDFAMPGMNGAEVARQIKVARPDLPILFVTGYADTQALESVADGEALVLRKPFSTAKLQETVSAMMRR